MGKTIPAALLLFGCGMASHWAWQAGLYGNATFAALFGLLLASGLLSGRTRFTPLRSEAGSTSPAGQSALEMECRRLQAMLDQAPVSVVTVDVEGEMHAANRAARTLFASDHRIASPPAALRDAIDRARPGERMVLKLRAPAQAGPTPPNAERSYALSVAVVLGTGPGDDVVRLAVLTDIQAELQAAEAATLRDLLDVLSHEIMNSLTPVTSLAESAYAILAARCAGDDIQHDAVGLATDALETILRRARGLDRFVRGYRMLARLPAPELRPGRLSLLLDEAAKLFRLRWKTEDVLLTLHRPEPEIILRADTDLLTQALLNLLANAAEAALAETVRPAVVTLSGFMCGNAAAIRVADSGKGVPVGQEETIFRLFFSLKPDGTGIGLSLARQIAHSHGGDLQLEVPTPGQGASFLLTI